MKHVRFLSDYRGHKTQEQYFNAGTVIELPDRHAFGLEEMGVAVLIDPPEPDFVPVSDEELEHRAVEAVIEPEDALVDIDGLNKKELKAIAKELKVERFSRMNQGALIDAILEARANAE